MDRWAGEICGIALATEHIQTYLVGYVWICPDIHIIQDWIILDMFGYIWIIRIYGLPPLPPLSPAEP